MAKANFRYRRVGYVARNLTDINKTMAFATDVFCLEESCPPGPQGERFLRSSPMHHDVVLYPSSSASFIRSGWELETEKDVDLAFAHYEALGLSPKWVRAEETGPLGLERAFRVREPNYQIQFEYYARMTYISTPIKRPITGFYGQGHFGMMIPEPKKLSDYMVENMGFLISDYIEGWPGTLLRAFPNPNHHSFAPLPSPRKELRFHHLAFMVNSIDDIGKLFNRAKRLNTQIQFGIGRHPTSGSIHLYLYDPDSFVWEYTLGMEQFPELNPREPRRMSSAPENYDLWGAVPEMDLIERAPGVVTR